MLLVVFFAPPPPKKKKVDNPNVKLSGPDLGPKERYREPHRTEPLGSY